MSTIKDYLRNIIKGVNMCALCLKEVIADVVSIHDETILESSQYTTIKDLIAFVMGYEESEISELLSFVCKDCTTHAIQCYTFMTMCRKSHSQLQNILNNISLDLDSLDKYCLAKTIYITVTNKKIDTKLILDKKKGAKTKRKASKRYKSLISKVKKVKKKTMHIDKTGDNFEQDMGSAKMTDMLTQMDNNIYKCMECLKVFQRSTNLKSHHNRVHAPKEFQCNKCPKKFGSEYLRRLHVTESHVTTMCTDCGKICNNIYSWKMHIASHQIKICPTCGKQYKSKNSYLNHINLQACSKGGILLNKNNFVHDYRYECDTCKKRFTQKGSLRVHIQFEHENGKTHVCSWCNKKFSAESKLKAHIVKHTRERNFTCEICGGKFVTKEALLYHTRIHTGEKPYPCPECNESFISASRRMEHLRRRHWAPMLECNICLSRFKTAFCLKKHRERHFDPNSRLFAQKSITGVDGHFPIK